MAVLWIASQVQPDVMHQLEILRPEAGGVRTEDVLPFPSVGSDHLQPDAWLGFGQALPCVAGKSTLLFGGKFIGEATHHQGRSQLLGGGDDRFEYIVGGYNHERDVLALLLGQVDNGRKELLLVMLKHVGRVQFGGSTEGRYSM